MMMFLWLRVGTGELAGFHTGTGRVKVVTSSETRGRHSNWAPGRHSNWAPVVTNLQPE
jgi:hypothetical protein